MKTKQDVLRLAIDIPKSNHRLLKAIAAKRGISMREIVLESINEQLKKRKKEEEICKHCSHKPNKKTIKAIQDARAGKCLTHYKSPADYFKKFEK